jgi:hypothetical protein
MALKTNFTDDILAESMNGKRQYNVTENSNGTKSLEDVTDYQSVGSTFSAKNMNETNAAVNQAYDDMGDEFNKNTKYLAGAVKIHNNKLWKFKVDHDPGEWDESQVRKTTLLDEIGELNEKMEVKYGTFTSSNNSIVQLQGAPNVVKYGHLVNVYFLVYLSIELNPGDVLGDLSFVPRSELSNIPIYAVDYVTSVRAINLRYTDGHTHVEIGGGNAVKSGTYAVSFSYES